MVPSPVEKNGRGALRLTRLTPLGYWWEYDIANHSEKHENIQGHPVRVKHDAKTCIMAKIGGSKNVK